MSGFNTPSGEQDSFLDPPRAPFNSFTPQDSAHSSPTNSATFLPAVNKSEPDGSLHETYRNPSPPRKGRRAILWLVLLAGIIIVVLAVVLPVYFTVIKPKNNTFSSSPTSSGQSSSSGGSPSGSGSPNSGTPSSAITTGGDGSTIKTEDGSTFTYTNKFGGYCECISPINRFSNPLP